MLGGVDLAGEESTVEMIEYKGRNGLEYDGIRVVGLDGDEHSAAKGETRELRTFDLQIASYDIDGPTTIDWFIALSQMHHDLRRDSGTSAAAAAAAARTDAVLYAAPVTQPDLGEVAARALGKRIHRGTVHAPRVQPHRDLEGYLEKLPTTGIVRRWQKRFFKVQGHYLMYKKEETDAEWLGGVDLEGEESSIVPSTKDGTLVVRGKSASKYTDGTVTTLTLRYDPFYAKFTPTELAKMTDTAPPPLSVWETVLKMNQGACALDVVDHAADVSLRTLPCSRSQGTIIRSRSRSRSRAYSAYELTLHRPLSMFFHCFLPAAKLRGNDDFVNGIEQQIKASQSTDLAAAHAKRTGAAPSSVTSADGEAMGHDDDDSDLDDGDAHGGAVKIATAMARFGKRRKARRMSMSTGESDGNDIEVTLLKRSKQGRWQQRFFSTKAHYMVRTRTPSLFIPSRRRAHNCSVSRCPRPADLRKLSDGAPYNLLTSVRSFVRSSVLLLSSFFSRSSTRRRQPASSWVASTSVTPPRQSSGSSTEVWAALSSTASASRVSTVTCTRMPLERSARCGHSTSVCHPSRLLTSKVCTTS